MWSFEWCHFQWPWMTLNPDFKVTSLFNDEYLINGMSYRHSYNSYNGLLIWTYGFSRMSFRMTLSDIEWVGKIFNHTKHRAVSLRQLSFLFWHCCRISRAVELFTFSDEGAIWVSVQVGVVDAVHGSTGAADGHYWATFHRPHTPQTLSKSRHCEVCTSQKDEPGSKSQQTEKVLIIFSFCTFLNTRTGCGNIN